MIMISIMILMVVRTIMIIIINARKYWAILQARWVGWWVGVCEHVNRPAQFSKLGWGFYKHDRAGRSDPRAVLWHMRAELWAHGAFSMACLGSSASWVGGSARMTAHLRRSASWIGGG